MAQTIKKLLLSPIAVIILTVISIFFSISLYRSAQKSTFSAQNLEALEREVATVKQEVKSLEDSLEAAEQPLNQEKIIRNELMMQKPGEYVVQIANQEENTADTKEKMTSMTPLQEWKEVIFGN